MLDFSVPLKPSLNFFLICIFLNQFIIKKLFLRVDIHSVSLRETDEYQFLSLKQFID